jgi:hypothetical protein
LGTDERVTGTPESYPVEPAPVHLILRQNVARALVLHEYGGPEKLKFEDNVPEPRISDSTVLIAAAAASVNPIDWKVRSGTRQKDFPLSFPANHTLNLFIFKANFAAPVSIATNDHCQATMGSQIYCCFHLRPRDNGRLSSNSPRIILSVPY